MRGEGELMRGAEGAESLRIEGMLLGDDCGKDRGLDRPDGVMRGVSTRGCDLVDGENFGASNVLVGATRTPLSLGARSAPL